MRGKLQQKGGSPQLKAPSMTKEVIHHHNNGLEEANINLAVGDLLFHGGTESLDGFRLESTCRWIRAEAGFGFTPGNRTGSQENQEKRGRESQVWFHELENGRIFCPIEPAEGPGFNRQVEVSPRTTVDSGFESGGDRPRSPDRPGTDQDRDR